MKKLLSLVLVGLFLFALTGCRREADITAPVIHGVEDVEILMGEDFNPMEGVTATDDVDGDITDRIVVTGTVDTSKVGTYFLRYAVEDSAGNRTEESRYVTVAVDPDLIGDSMVPNGDFSLGWALWSTSTGNEGGNGTFEVVNEELKIDITSVSGGMWEPRLESDLIEFEQGKMYEVTFDARAVAPRAIHVQIGELLPAAPWFVNFKPAVPVVVDLTTEMETYTFQFKMDMETNPNGRLLFEFGTVAGTIGTDNLLTTVYLDNVDIKVIDEIVDTVAPVISGANDRSIVEGTEFDPLEGVTVLDNVDGEITLTMDHVTGEVDVDTPGEYTLTYTVSDEAGNEAVVTRIITVLEAVEEDEPKTADYGWRVFVNDWEGTAGTGSVMDGEYILTLTNINTSANWNIQIIQDSIGMGGIDEEGTMQLEAGRTYRVSFDARASVAGEIAVAFGHPGDGWTEYYMEENIAITTETQTITFEFTLDAEGDYDILSQFKLEMGMLFTGQEGEQYFALSNVKIDILEDTEFVDAELIVNGNFEAEEIRAGSIYGWRSFVNNWEGTVGSVTFFNGHLRFNLETLNNLSDNWKLQIIQDSIAFGEETEEGTIQFEAGKTYRLTFDARASIAGDITFVIGHPIDGWNEYYSEVVSITRTWDTYTVEFTLDDPEMDYTTLAQFKFEMGLMFADQDGPQYFDLDNVMIEVVEDEEYVETDLIVNGDFSMIVGSTFGWRTFVNDWEGTKGYLDFVAGHLRFTLVDLNNLSDNWKLQVIQDAYALGTGEDNEGSMQFEAGKTYRVTFDARASLDGDITFVIGNSDDGWVEYYAENVTITRSWDTYTVEFTLDDPELDYLALAQFKFEMGLLFAGAAGPQYFDLDRVTIEVLEDAEYVDADLIVNGDFDMVVGSTYGWRAFTNFWEGTDGSGILFNGHFRLHLESLNNLTDNWKLQIIQDSVAFGEEDEVGTVQFEAGNTYRVTFDARASLDGDFNFVIGNPVDGWTEYYNELLTVSNHWQTFTVEFTLDDPEMDYTTLAQFKLEMGLMFEGAEGPQYFDLDNVLIEVLVGEDFVDAELIVNGDFMMDVPEETGEVVNGDE